MEVLDFSVPADRIANGRVACVILRRGACIGPFIASRVTGLSLGAGPSDPTQLAAISGLPVLAAWRFDRR